MYFPVNRNKVLLRVENIADRFDYGQNSTIYIDLVEIAYNLWEESNGNEIAKPQVEI